MGQALKHHPCRGASAPRAPASELPTRSERLSPGQVTRCSSQARWNHIIPPLVINTGTAHSAGQTPISRAPGFCKILNAEAAPSKQPSSLGPEVPCATGASQRRWGRSGLSTHRRDPRATRAPVWATVSRTTAHPGPPHIPGPPERTVGFFLRSRIAS